MKQDWLMEILNHSFAIQFTSTNEEAEKLANVNCSLVGQDSAHTAIINHLVKWIEGKKFIRSGVSISFNVNEMIRESERNALADELINELKGETK